MVEAVLARSSTDGCLVLVDVTGEANLRWANNTLTTNGVTRSTTTTVIAVRGRSVGVVSRQGAGAGDVDDLVAAAEAVAAQAPEAEDAAPLVGADAASGDWDAEPAGTSIRVFERFAADLGESLRRAAAHAQLLYGFAYHRMTTTYLGSSTGLRARFDQPTGQFELNGKSSDLARSSWVGAASDDFSDIDIAALHDELDRRLGWATRSVDLPAGRYDTILPPGAVGDMLIYMYWSAAARDAHEGRTVFSRPGGGTRVGERICGPLTLRSDPASPGLECMPFMASRMSGPAESVFDNGVALGPTTWIDDGTLASLVQTRHSAAMTGLPLTPYIDNLVLEGAEPAGTTDDLVAETERGLLLTCLWYIREVDPQTLLLTGLTRDGVYLVEHGEVTAAVNNFRFNESPLGLLGRAESVGRTERTLPREWNDYFNRTAMPPLRISGFNMSSVSQAS
jgi:predicted Zn-dependent protease